MPIDTDVQRELTRLSGLAAAQTKQIASLTARIDTLERSPQLGQLVAAIDRQTVELASIANAAHGPYGGLK